jgi:Patatin phospholipase
VLDYTGDCSDKCVFQIDLFSARGAMPQTLLEVARREKEIRYSSRTRLNTDAFREAHIIRRAPRRQPDKLPPPAAKDGDRERLRKFAGDATITIVHLIYGARPMTRTPRTSSTRASRSRSTGAPAATPCAARCGTPNGASG